MTLTLVYNPVGPSLPPPQETLEAPMAFTPLVYELREEFVVGLEHRGEVFVTRWTNSQTLRLSE